MANVSIRSASVTLGFRILPRKRKVDAEMVDRFKGLPVANVSDVMSRMSAGGASLRPYHGGGYMAGPALTVKTRPGDNLMIHKALLLAEPGDAIVVDAGGDLTSAMVGELMLSHAMKIGVAGIVINGAVRDSAWIRANNFPVYAAGVTHRGPYKDGPGEINVPIALGGMVIEPGDLILGDDDGLLCVPFAETEAIHAAAKTKNEAEARTLANTQAGKLDPKTWVDETLRRLGCEGV
jgi:regulator of RNase E activity RraA